MAFFGKRPGSNPGYIPRSPNIGFSPNVLLNASQGTQPDVSGSKEVNYGFHLPQNTTPSLPYPLSPPCTDAVGNYPPYPTPDPVSSISPSLGFSLPYSTPDPVSSISPSLGFSLPCATPDPVSSISPSLGFSLPCATPDTVSSISPSLGVSLPYPFTYMSSDSVSPVYPPSEPLCSPPYPMSSDVARGKPLQTNLSSIDKDDGKDARKDSMGDILVTMKIRTQGLAHHDHSKEERSIYSCDLSSVGEERGDHVIRGYAGGKRECKTEHYHQAGKSHQCHANIDRDTFLNIEKSLTANLARISLQATKGATWFSHLAGNVKIPEICYYSVTGTCKDEERGCDRLHCDQKFYWQFSIQEGIWLNLPLSWVNFLERKYTDPAQESVSVPRMQEVFGNAQIRELLPVGERDCWTVNLQKMCLVNSGRSLLYRLRRLDIEKIPGDTDISNNFVWYFKDSNSKWEEYGKTDKTGITSDKIECHFQTVPDIPLTFTVSNVTYILDKEKMTQTNTSTRAVCEVRRRPKTHHQVKISPRECQAIKQVESILAENHLKLPESWEIMDPKEKARRVPLLSSSEEYRSVVKFLKGEIGPDKICKVERIQNPYLWRAFRNKVNEMTSAYGSSSGVNIQKLFHGTQSVVVDSIIRENFDWRLHGTITGQLHGQGTYFSTKASQSYGYCKNDSHGNKYLFIALVAVGTITPGNSTMTRPPINPAKNAPYDSTGSGSIIVKYDKQEYYPEYVLTLKS